MKCHTVTRLIVSLSGTAIAVYGAVIMSGVLPVTKFHAAGVRGLAVGEFTAAIVSIAEAQ